MATRGSIPGAIDQGPPSLSPLSWAVHRARPWLRAATRLLLAGLTVLVGALPSGALERPAAAATSDPVLVGAGGIASCASPGDQATAALLDGIPGTVFTAGDNAYDSGTPAQFARCYDTSWGRHKARTRPTPGNHDYATRGAAGYFGYFGAAAGEAGKGYYSYDLGSWHIVALNSNCAQVGGCGAGSAEEQWLRADLAASHTPCTLAYWHHQRFSSDSYAGGDPEVETFWEDLYHYGADVVLGGHARVYERFAPQDPSGQADPTFGIRQFTLGTGGAGHIPFASRMAPNSEVGNADTWGVLKLTLHPSSYDWQFLPVAGATFTDAGTGTCHGPPGNQPPLAQNANATTTQGTPVAVTLPGSDAETCELAFSVVTGPAHGTLSPPIDQPCTPGSPNSDSLTVTYTPTAGFTGTDAFTFQVSDGSATSTATAAVAVNPTGGDTPPTASGAAVTSPQGTAVAVTLRGSDAETCELAFSVVAGPSHGTLSLPTDQACVSGSPNTDSATVTYTPTAGFTGNDSLTFGVTDGAGNSALATATMTVNPTPVDSPPLAGSATATTTRTTPVAITLHGSDTETCELAFSVVAGPAHGTLSPTSDHACVSGNPNTDSAVVTYTPTASFTGTDSFTFQVSDGSAVSTATATVTVKAPTTVHHHRRHR